MLIRWTLNAWYIYIQCFVLQNRVTLHGVILCSLTCFCKTMLKVSLKAIEIYFRKACLYGQEFERLWQMLCYVSRKKWFEIGIYLDDKKYGYSWD